MRRSAVEKTLTYATTVDSLTDAWTFVMEHVDVVGPFPRISISPVWRFTDDDNDEVFFEVSVSAMTTEE